MSEATSTLKIDGLKVSRGGKPVLHGISLEVAPGQVTTLLGPNGAGKSTMVLAVGGVLRPDRRRGLARRHDADADCGRSRSARRASRSSPRAAGSCPS